MNTKPYNGKLLIRNTNTKNIKVKRTAPITAKPSFTTQSINSSVRLKTHYNTRQ